MTMPEQHGHISPAEGLARFAELWGPRQDTPQQAQADAWARRALGLPAEPGDAPLLDEVDAALAAKHGLRRAS